MAQLVPELLPFPGEVVRVICHWRTMVTHIRNLLILILILVAANHAIPDSTQTPKDPLAAEIERWKIFLKENKATNEDWTSLRDTAQPIMAKAEQALAEDRRLYALHALATIRPFLAAQKYLQDQPAESLKQLSVLEAEWNKAGTTLKPVLNQPARTNLDAVPAAVRAVGEAAYSEIQPYYEASIEYGKNTVPDAGLYYLGSALAQLEFARFCATLSGEKPLPAPNFPSLSNEIDQFETQLLAAYKPPASIDSHPIFIRTSAMIKQARELYAAGMYEGALCRYLSARIRFSKLTPGGPTISAEEAVIRAKEVSTKLDQDAKDQSIARMYVEMAVQEASDTTPNSDGKETARIIFDDVLPHYFLAMQPAPAAPPLVPAKVTVTLVRWPYT
jgi:hypothetical protein